MKLNANKFEKKNFDYLFFYHKLLKFSHSDLGSF